LRRASETIVGALLVLKLSRCLRLSQGFGARRRLFPSVCKSVCAVTCADHVIPRAERMVHNVSQACDAQPDRISIFNHGASGERRPRRTLRSHEYHQKFLKRGLGQKGPRRKLRSHDCQRSSRKLRVHAVALCSPCAHHFPRYANQAAAYAMFARLSKRIK
jgi:hypothetical protein